MGCRSQCEKTGLSLCRKVGWVANVILKNVVKEFKSVTAVDRLSSEIHDREFAVLVGPSG